MNKQFIIIPLVSAGEIKFGMEREKVRGILGNYSEYRNRQEDSNTADCFDICQVFYNENDCVEFIMFHALDKIELKYENKILTKMSKDELISFLLSLDENISFDADMERCESNAFGIACYFVRDIYIDEEGNENEFDRVETISVSIEDYWK